MRTENVKNIYTLGILVAMIILMGVWRGFPQEQVFEEFPVNGAPKEETVVLKARWGDLGAKMVQAGVIDGVKFEEIYAEKGGLNKEMKQLLYGTGNGNLIITSENAGVILNLLWALGLGNKNDILEKGEMTDPRYGDTGRFASTGGWTIAKGNAMDHYSKHKFIVLTDEQQKLVERVSKNIYRPCCDNSTHFPDCNHGMAMLGFLELLVFQGANEKEMYESALKINSFWFKEQYAVIASYLESKGKISQFITPKEILGKEYSSASGYQAIVSKMKQNSKGSTGSACGV